MTRQCLPNRREHELLTFEHEGIRYTAGVGRFADGGLAEIFLNAAKRGTALDVNARDAAVAVPCFSNTAARWIHYVAP